MRKIVLSILILLLILCAVGCSYNEEDGKSNTVFDVFYTIPDEFTFANAQYKKVECEIDKSSFTTKVGYLINAEDLEKWKIMDNDEKLIYATSESEVKRRYTHNDIYGHLKNRFEIFSNGNNDSYLVVRCENQFEIFNKLQEDINDEL